MKYSIDDVKRLLVQQDIPHRADGWFLPSDMVPHSSAFKYACKKLYEEGKLEKRGNSHDRWGFQYRIKEGGKSCG